MIIEFYKKNNLIINLIVISLLILFFPYFLLDGIPFWLFKSDLDYYEKFAPFLSIPLNMVTVVLVYKAYVSQKKELEDTSKALSIQSSVSVQQQFDSVFFKLIELRNQYELKISYRDINGILRNGTDAFSHASIDLNRQFTLKQKSHNKENLKHIIEEYILKKNSSIRSYIRIIENNIEIIRDTFIGDNTKQEQYISILFSTLRYDEITFLYYYYFCNDQLMLQLIRFNEYIKKEAMINNCYWFYEPDPNN